MTTARADLIDTLNDSLTQGRKTITHWIKQHTRLAAAGVTEQQIQEFTRIIATGELTSDNIKALSESGINIKI